MESVARPLRQDSVARKLSFDNGGDKEGDPSCDNPKLPYEFFDFDAADQEMFQEASSFMHYNLEKKDEPLLDDDRDETWGMLHIFFFFGFFLGCTLGV